MNVKIVNIDEVNTEELFMTRDLLLGDKGGRFFVVADGTCVGRYILREDAQKHVDGLLAPPNPEFEGMTTKELIEKAALLAKQILGH